MIPEKWLGDLYENKKQKKKKKQEKPFARKGQYLFRPGGRFKILWVIGFFKAPLQPGIFFRKSLFDGRDDTWWYLYAADTALNVHESTMCNAGKQQA